MGRGAVVTIWLRDAEGLGDAKGPLQALRSPKSHLCQPLVLALPERMPEGVETEKRCQRDGAVYRRCRGSAEPSDRALRVPNNDRALTLCQPSPVPRALNTISFNPQNHPTNWIPSVIPNSPMRKTKILSNWEKR